MSGLVGYCWRLSGATPVVITPAGGVSGWCSWLACGIGKTDIGGNITSNSAKSGGVIGDSGNVYRCMGRGVVYSSVETSPTASTNNTVQTYDFSNTSSNFGSYPSMLTGLTPNTTYYVRAYMGYEIIATRELIFLNGEVRSFKTAP